MKQSVPRVPETQNLHSVFFNQYFSYLFFFIYCKSCHTKIFIYIDIFQNLLPTESLEHHLGEVL